MRKIKIILLILLCNLSVFSQKIDTDSLLIQTNKQINIEKNYNVAKKMGLQGVKLAPNYLDFHVALGRIYKLTNQPDSSRYYFNHVMNKNPKYKEVFIYLTNLEIETNSITNAQSVIEKAVQNYPEDKEIAILKLRVTQLEDNDDKTIEYLKILTEKYPDDPKIKQQYNEFKNKTNSTRIGISYNYSFFSRDNYGPWHLGSLQFVKETKKITGIARLNFADRRAFGASINSGIQYELESYFWKIKKSYQYANVSYSNSKVFPKLRLSYSYYRNLNNGWEGDIGIRYTKTSDRDLYAGVLGIGKYVGPYWLNFKTYLSFRPERVYPAFTTTARYYTNTRYDYYTASIGYGTSPDERETIGQFQERVTLQSYRFGLGYHKLITANYIFGLNGSVNHQEYKINTFQNEFNVFLSLQYIF